MTRSLKREIGAILFVLVLALLASGLVARGCADDRRAGAAATSPTRTPLR
jgi:hypothetical protein